MLSARAYLLGLRLLAASLFVLLTLSCDRGTAPERERSASAALAELSALAAPLPSVAARLRPTERGWATRAGATRSPGSGSGELVAELPTEASGELRIGVGSGAALQTRWRLAGARDAALVVDQGRAIYQEALPSTDLVLTAEDRSAEILFVLRDRAAPSTFRFDVALPRDLVGAELERSGGLALVDARGDKRLGVGKAVAVDAVGTLRDATMRWSDGALTLALNTEGLVHPIVLDPVVQAIAWRLAVPQLARSGHAMAYDSFRDEVVMFGGSFGYGQNGQVLAADGTWIWTSVTGWTQRVSQMTPSPRVSHTMAYDSQRKRVVLFGGEDAAGNPFEDTWEWDGTNWEEVSSPPDVGPSARRDAAMAYDADAGKVVLFGGWIGFDVLALQKDTWTWDGNTWADVTDPNPDASPAPRAEHAMTYDPDTKRVVMYGGYSGSDFPYSDTWVWSAAMGWTSLSIPPNDSRRLQGHAMAHIPNVGIVMVGGSDNVWLLSPGASDWSAVSIPTGAEGFSSTTMVATKDGALWFGGDRIGADGTSWTTTDGSTWQEHSPRPSPRNSAALAYDATSKQLLLVGGSTNVMNYGGSAETWGWAKDRWSLLSMVGPTVRSDHAMAAYSDGVLLFGGYGEVPPPADPGTLGDLGDTWVWLAGAWVEQAPAVSPTARSGHGLATNVGGKGVLLFGGTESESAIGDTWVWDGAKWTEQTGLSPTPSARVWHAMAYDAKRDQVVLFGGMDINYQLSSETWIWDGAQWENRPVQGPPPLVGATMAYDGERETVVLTGGTDDNWKSSAATWEWDGAEWAGPTGGDYTAREHHTMGYHGARKQMVLFGGLTDHGSVDDTWVYDNFDWRPNGEDCGDDVTSCDSGFCVDGVCCNTACDGVCEACDVGGTEGTCTITKGATCDDANACTSADVCTSQGECAGTAVECKASDICHLAGVCDPSTGQCSDPVCTDDCPAECSDQTCGNGVREGTEACDGSDLGAAICTEQGQGKGTLACKSDCTFDVSGCACPPVDSADENPCQSPVRQGDGPCVSVSKPDGSLCPGGECVAGTCIGEPPPPPPPPGPGQGTGASTGTGSKPGQGAGGASSGKADATDDASADGACTVASPGAGGERRSAWLAVAALSALSTLARRRRAA